jgi:hypothetical protein
MKLPRDNNHEYIEFLPEIEFMSMYCNSCKHMMWIKKDSIEPMDNGMWGYVR